MRNYKALKLPKSGKRRTSCFFHFFFSILQIRGKNLLFLFIVYTGSSVSDPSSFFKDPDAVLTPDPDLMYLAIESRVGFNAEANQDCLSTA